MIGSLISYVSNLMLLMRGNSFKSTYIIPKLFLLSLSIIVNFVFWTIIDAVTQRANNLLIQKIHGWAFQNWERIWFSDEYRLFFNSKMDESLFTIVGINVSHVSMRWTARRRQFYGVGGDLQWRQIRIRTRSMQQPKVQVPLIWLTEPVLKYQNFNYECLFWRLYYERITEIVKKTPWRNPKYLLD